MKYIGYTVSYRETETHIEVPAVQAYVFTDTLQQVSDITE